MNLTAKRPPAHWDRLPPDPRVPQAERYTYAGLTVLSELGMKVEAPDGSKDMIPQWLVTVSKNGRRVSDADVARVRRAFDMEEAEEDNHFPGVSRAFFLVVDPARRVACECKVGDVVVTEADGYQWSNDPKDCQGCAYERSYGKPCPVHKPTEVAAR